MLIIGNCKISIFFRMLIVFKYGRYLKTISVTYHVALLQMHWKIPRNMTLGHLSCSQTYGVSTTRRDCSYWNCSNTYSNSKMRKITSTMNNLARSLMKSEFRIWRHLCCCNSKSYLLLCHRQEKSKMTSRARLLGRTGPSTTWENK